MTADVGLYKIQWLFYSDPILITSAMPIYWCDLSVYVAAYIHYITNINISYVGQFFCFHWFYWLLWIKNTDKKATKTKELVR